MKTYLLCKQLPVIGVSQFHPTILIRTVSTGICLWDSKQNKELSKKYSKTLFLPKTSFPMKIEGKKRVERDREIFSSCKFNDQYAWQKENRVGPEFILHDGPPYANGDPHMGHAVNKVLKDITVRYQCGQGKQVNFVPGWDCHGLPIEMKAVKGDKKLSTSKVREIAAKYAEKTVKEQKAVFKSWGILADWDQPYLTMSSSFVKTQLDKFYALYSAGFIFRDYMPVWWSPSSRTALAEAELEYNNNHQSRSVYLRLRLDTMSEMMEDLTCGSPVYGLVWTTTAWSIVANRAVCYNPKVNYSLVKNMDSFYIVASSLMKDPGVMAALPDLVEVASIQGDDLAKCSYIRPLGGQTCPFLAGGHVTSSSGTGLVHTAPAHGQDDFKIGLERGLQLECMVGEDGRYMECVGHGLGGMEVMGEGGSRVVELLGEEVMHSEVITHSYPYDWRTKKPVFLRGSKQWFIDTNKLKDKALEVLKDVKIQPESAVNGFRGVVDKRPYWCISRQRVWGTFIPVIYSNEGEMVISKELLERYKLLVDEEGSGFWWNLTLEQILEGTSYEASEHRREGLDIMDIWLDSGISWASVLKDNTQADLYMEGLDQFSGWFYSSLLTSVALTGKSPYKRLFVHGFTLDEAGNKMSKSLGNVISPQDVVEKQGLGVDVLRWWVAKHASSSTSVHVGKSILLASKAEVDKMRNTFRFLLGQLSQLGPDYQMIDYDEMVLLDQAALYKLSTYQALVKEHYNNLEYSKVCLATLNFMTELSSTYLHLCKDRMYCDGANWSSRQSGVTTMLLLARGLGGVLAPIMPHLTEEMNYCCEALGSNFQRGWVTDEGWRGSSSTVELVKRLEEIREEINKEGIKSGECHAVITMEDKYMDEMKRWPEKQVAELLGVVSVEVVKWKADHDIVEVKMAEGSNCLRCRRLVVYDGEEICGRCQEVIS